MDIKSIIRKKRERKELTKDEIRYFVGKLMKEEITEAQAAAVLSYIYINGLTEDEILYLSVAMAESGDMIDLSDISQNIVDKHATGGIGDKATILLMPILAALEIPVAKVSSRGYGISGGTIDKLESIPGLKTDFSIDEFKRNIKNVGACIMNQGLNFAPAEGKIYKLRNQVACENSLPIIASSLMSLKVATGSNKIVFDITCGKGTYIKTYEDARRLAKLLVRLGKALEKEIACVITNMNQPIGYSIGHNLEMRETVMALKGIISQDLSDVVETLGSVMIALATDNKDLNANVQMIREVLQTGKAYEKFKQMVASQGGNLSFLEDPELFEKSKFVIPVLSTESGIVESIDADIVGSIATYLGAGRMKDTGKINRTAGITINKKIGDTVTVGETLAYIHTEDESKISGTTQNLKEAFKITNKKINTKSRVLEIIK
ncbi:MAG: thymidine phosphorylase [Clostridia bacterium]|nr:thymidine phosphorylase [Clostridia bacterium]